MALSIGHADCLAVVLVDVEAGLLGLAHAGWRGALAKLPLKLAEAMITAGAESSRLRVLLSPCLSPAGLELSEEQYRDFAAAFDKLEGIASPLKQGKFHLDLRAAVSAPLLALGVPGAQIVSQALHSDAQEELFFSYRRDQARTGRMLTTAFLR